MSALHEALEAFELRALQLGLTGAEIRIAQESGLTLEEMHDLKFNKGKTHENTSSITHA